MLCGTAMADECKSITVNKLSLGMSYKQVGEIVPILKLLKKPQNYGVVASPEWRCYRIENRKPDKTRVACFENNFLVLYKTTRPDTPNTVIEIVSGKYGAPSRTGDISTGVQATGMMAAWEFEDCNTMLRIDRVMSQRFGKILMVDVYAEHQTAAAYDTAIVLTRISEAAEATDVDNLLSQLRWVAWHA